MVQKSWQEHKIEQLLRRERSWGIREIIGLVVLREGASTLLVVACMCIRLNYIGLWNLNISIKYAEEQKSRHLLIYLNRNLQLEYWQQVHFNVNKRLPYPALKFLLLLHMLVCPFFYPFFCCSFHNTCSLTLDFMYFLSIPQTTLFLSCIWIWKKRGRERKKRRSRNLREHSSHLEENCLWVWDD